MTETVGNIEEYPMISSLLDSLSIQQGFNTELKFTITLIGWKGKAGHTIGFYIPWIEGIGENRKMKRIEELYTKFLWLYIKEL